MLLGDAGFHNLHQLLNLLVLLAQLRCYLCRMVSIPQSSVVASFLVTVLFSVLNRCARVANEQIELVYFLFDVLGVLLETLRLFATFLTQFVFKNTLNFFLA